MNPDLPLVNRRRLLCGCAGLAGPPQQPAEQALAALWHRADTALYAAKAQGRDRVMVA